MKRKINLILGLILLVCITQVQAQEAIPVQFRLTDHNDDALTGMLRVRIMLFGDQIFRDPQDVYIYGGACNLPIDMNLKEGDRGTIKVTYIPSEIPLGKNPDGEEMAMSTPLVNEKGIGLDSPPEEFILPAKMELSFDITFAFDDVEVISKNKTGAEREAAKSSEWSKNTKLELEVGMELGFFSASESLEIENGESESKTLIDREMSETEEGKRWTAKIPTGKLTIKQTNSSEKE